MGNIMDTWFIPLVVGVIASLLALVIIKLCKKPWTLEKVIGIAIIFFVIVTVVTYCLTRSDEPPSEKKLDLSPAPNSWGKTIPGSSGTVYYYNNFLEPFSGRIELKGLVPNHSYVLTLNKKPEVNDKLPKTYIDFLQVVTNSVGDVNSEFNVKLPSGDYNVKFFVKDTDDWKIVLYNDFLIFTVR